MSFDTDLFCYPGDAIHCMVIQQRFMPGLGCGRDSVINISVDVLRSRRHCRSLARGLGCGRDFVINISVDVLRSRRHRLWSLARGLS